MHNQDVQKFSQNFVSCWDLLQMNNGGDLVVDRRHSVMYVPYAFTQQQENILQAKFCWFGLFCVFILF